jgi:hypothetical protein
MPRFLTYGVLALLAMVHIVAVGRLTDHHAVLEKAVDDDQVYTLPASILKVAALDYHGLVSDFLFVKGMVYLGGFASARGPQKPFHLNESQWRAFYRLMDVASDLDPYFQDPYYVANAFLTWDAGMIDETNILLEKGSRARAWDWTMPYFIGFNEFFFLDDNENASWHLMEASRRPKASPVLASIAARLAFKGNRIDTAILFLEDLMSRTDDESLKKVYSLRLRGLNNLKLLGQASDIYRKRTGKTPHTIEQLVHAGIIETVPEDPYGGHYYVENNGKVRCTTEDQLGVLKRNPAKKVRMN